ncbi:MAG: TetR family transcriptional regulator [Actinobacteria bacterium]|nr:MAG: TetR family transcriptional regulator [Actinomycetota bacterium]
MVYYVEVFVGGQAATVSKGEKTRRRIVGHATLLMYERGYAKTTIDDVIAVAGVTKGSFYFHFASKEELGYAVIENATQHILGSMRESLVRPDLTPYERIEFMLEGIQGIVEAADCSRGCILGNLALETSNLSEGFRERIARAFRSWSELIACELEEMKEAGEVPPDFDCAAYADFAISALEGGIMISKVTRDPTPMRNNVVLILEQFANLQERCRTGQKAPSRAKR